MVPNVPGKILAPPEFRPRQASAASYRSNTAVPAQVDHEALLELLAERYREEWGDSGTPNPIAG